MNRLEIQFGCDLGERSDADGAAIDAALLDCITMANIACGGHAGDEQSMRRVVADAARKGVLIGAHPSYEDRVRFGRASVPLAAGEIAALVQRQVSTLAAIALDCGAALTHVKPHGALYHDAMYRAEVATAIADGVAAVDPSLWLLGLTGAAGLDIWQSRGFTVLREAFADRRYESDGSLRSREYADSLIDDPAQCAEQARRLASGEKLETIGGNLVTVACDVICIHSDSARATERALAVRNALTFSG